MSVHKNLYYVKWNMKLIDICKVIKEELFYH